jgi:hypothetical protein
VTHYFFEGCQYYTPMMSGDGHVERRDPTWVSEEEASRKVDDFEGYEAGRIRAIVEANVPAGESVIVVSGGDDELLALGGRRAVHFPQNANGTHAGYHPASSEDAVAELERLRSAGAGYLLLPNAAFWWLDHYTGLADTLDASGEIVARDDHCLVFALRRS